LWHVCNFSILRQTLDVEAPSPILVISSLDIIKGEIVCELHVLNVPPKYKVYHQWNIWELDLPSYIKSGKFKISRSIASLRSSSLGWKLLSLKFLGLGGNCWAYKLLGSSSFWILTWLCLHSLPTMQRQFPTFNR
jgi:hypothetical protein